MERCRRCACCGRPDALVGAPARVIHPLDEKAAKSVSFAAQWYVNRWNQYARGLKKIG
jgi:carbonic anhydrase/acetyltransferase-like protein (isoleucine patch superfamily)